MERTAKGPELAMVPANAMAAGRRSLLFADHDVTQAEGPSLGATHPTSRIEQLGRVLLADDAGKGDRQSKPMMKTEHVRNWH